MVEASFEEEETSADSEVSDLEMSRHASGSSRGDTSRRMEADETIILLSGQEPVSTRNWASQMKPGRFIMIADMERTLYHRGMIVMAKSDDGSLQCVSLCHHPGLDPTEKQEHLKTHVPVYPQRSGETSSKTTVIVSFQAGVEKMCDLRENCYINYQHVWTITIRSDVLLSPLGHVKGFAPVLDRFCEMQKDLYKEVERKVREAESSGV